MPSIYEAEEDLLRLRRSVVKHSRVLSWRGVVVQHPLLLTVARRRAAVGGRWGPRREVAGSVLAYNGSGRRQGGRMVSLVDRAAWRLNNTVSERSVLIQDWQRIREISKSLSQLGRK